MAMPDSAQRPGAERAPNTRALRGALTWSATLAAALLGLAGCVTPWAQPPSGASNSAASNSAVTDPPGGDERATGARLGTDAGVPALSAAATPQVAGPVEASSALSAAAAPYPHDDERRLALARALAGEPGWNLFESASWFLTTPVDDPLLVEGVKLRLEAVRARLHAELAPRNAAAHRSKPLVRIQASRSTFEAAGGQRGTSGFWIGPERTLVIYDAGADRAETTWPALQHVAVHAYLDDELGLESVPPWFLYGVAARYESLVHRELRTGGAALLEPPPAAERARLVSAVEEDAPMPLGELLAFDRDAFFGANRYGSGGFRNLVLAHAFIRFLETAEAGTSAELDRSRSAYLGAAFRALQDGLDGGAAAERARGVVPAAQLDAAWRTWIESETGQALPSSR